MPATFPFISVTSGTAAQSEMVNRAAAAGITQPTGGLSQADMTAYIIANLLMGAGAGNANSVATGLTALASGGQAGATPITKPISVIGTCATIGDSVLLPVSTPGAVCVIKNNGATPVDIFPAGSETINGLAASTAVRVNNGSLIKFVCVVAGAWHAQMPQMPPAKYVTAAFSSSTATAGQLSGAAFVTVANTGATPGTLTTRTATQMFADQGNVTPGDSYILRVVNAQGTGTLTLGGAAAGVTYTGTMTVAANTFRDFVVTFTTATACVIQNAAVGTFS